MKPADGIRWLRVAASAFFLTVVTTAFIGAPAMLTAIAQWGVQIQPVPAILSFSLGSFVMWVIITLVFGRIYCSWVCPLGALQDIVARMRRKRRYRYRPSSARVQLVILVGVIVASVFGLAVFLSLLDPLSAYGRIVANVVHPHLAGAVVAAVTLAVVAVMAWKGGRLYCNTICPVGGALGIICRTSFFHIEIDPDRCTRCRRCVDVCKASCIEIDTCTVDFSRCVTCFDCLSACPDGVIRYTPDRKQLMTPMFQRTERRAQPTVMSRRDFMAVTAAAVSVPLLSGCRRKADDVIAAASGKVPTRTTTPVAPPGAMSRKIFLDRCTGCGRCVTVCPTHVLRPSTTEYGIMRALHPVADYDAAYCLYECNECTLVCPTGALTPLSVRQKQLAPIGVASVTATNCVHCGRCAEQCPTHAVTMVTRDGEKPLPAVAPALCIGCGHCQSVCPATPFKAIIVNGNII